MTIIRVLKEKLRPVPASGLEANRPKFMSGTQVKILEKINSWTQETSYPNALSLIGGIGTGKSTIAKTVAQ